MNSIDSILEQLQSLYQDAVSTLRDDVIAFGRDGTLPDPARRSDGSYAYPQLTLRYSGIGDPKDRSRAFGRLELRALTPPRSPVPICSRPISRAIALDRRGV